MSPKITESIQTLDIAGESEDSPRHYRFWGSVRMTYTLCAFTAMTLHLCMRNSLNFLILCMVRRDPVLQAESWELDATNAQCGRLLPSNTSGLVERVGGDLEWTRTQELTLQGTYFYGYLVTLPVAGVLADKFGGKLLFVHSITAQAIVFMAIPFCARVSYALTVAVRVLQGLIAGLGNPSLYQLFSTWAHPTERTSLLSFAYGGFSLGALIIFPISSFLCELGWEFAFYAVGGVSLLVGISFQWLVYSSLEEHPRLSKGEYEYLKAASQEKQMDKTIPWRSIATSVPVYAFALTHIFHSYGITVLTLMTPRFLRETMQYSLSEVGVYSSVPFVGSLAAKIVSVTTCKSIERRPHIDLTIFKRIVYVLCNVVCILFLVGIILCDCHQRTLVVLFTLFVGVTSGLSFSGAYWPSLLYVAPSFAGLLSGISNCMAGASGFLAPHGISAFVANGTKSEWNIVMITMIVTYGMGAVVYGLFGSAKLQTWGQHGANGIKS